MRILRIDAQISICLKKVLIFLYKGVILDKKNIKKIQNIDLENIEIEVVIIEIEVEKIEIKIIKIEIKDKEVEEEIKNLIKKRNIVDQENMIEVTVEVHLQVVQVALVDDLF